MLQCPGFHRLVSTGIRAYAKHSKEWLFHSDSATKAVIRPLKQWDPHGIIAHFDDAKIAREILDLGKPVVDVAYILDGLDVPTVDVDPTAIGQLAADYFLARGYRHFGFLGSGMAIYPKLREAGFRKTVEKAGFEVCVCHTKYLPYLPRRTSWTKVDSRIRKWLSELKKPVAILADHDATACDLIDTCWILGIRVPDEVAILGVNNQELQCEIAFPPLSSIAVPTLKIGFEAARLLDQMMSGKPVAAKPLFLPPIRVVTRQSTSLFAVDEPIVTAALHHIRNHLAEPLGVNNICTALCVCRRTLERKFRELLGHSILEEIRRVRIERAKELLASTDLPISRIARQSGFSTARRFAEIFRTAAGSTPSEYRREIQMGRQV